MVVCVNFSNKYIDNSVKAFSRANATGTWRIWSTYIAYMVRRGQSNEINEMTITWFKTFTDT